MHGGNKSTFHNWLIIGDALKFHWFNKLVTQYYQKQIEIKFHDNYPYCYGKTNIRIKFPSTLTITVINELFFPNFN